MPTGRSHKPRYPISRRVKQVPASGIRPFFDLIASMEGVISLGVGEPDYPTPWRIREAGIYALEKGYTMYTSNAGLPELREELAAYLAKRYSLEYRPEGELLITSGVSEGLDLALRAILNPGDEVISPEPTYVAYSACTILAGGKFVPVLTHIENDFQARAQDIERKVTPRTRAILLGYPNNPTGAVMGREALQTVADVARRHDLLVISDEIYDLLVYEGEHVSVPTLEGMKERTILLGGFSKGFAMTGWRLGYAAGPAELIAAMTKIHQYAMLCAPIMSQMAALEALRSGADDAEDMRLDYDRRRRVMVKGLNDIGLPCFMPGGAFYAFPHIGGTGLSSETFAERLLMEEKVAVIPGSVFGQAGEGYVRCCYATAMPQIEEALERMRRFVERQGG